MSEYKANWFEKNWSRLIRPIPVKLAVVVKNNRRPNRIYPFENGHVRIVVRITIEMSTLVEIFFKERCQYKDIGSERAMVNRENPFSRSQKFGILYRVVHRGNEIYKLG